MTQETLISYADLEKMGWPAILIEDYQGLKRDLIPQTSDTVADPNNVYISNSNGMFIYTGATKAIWFNSVRGQKTGWIQIV
jgi:hypothetical protein